MLPSIRDGDVVTVSTLRGRRARFGEVVAFTSPTAGLVVHRVVARRAGRYEIRADNARGRGDVVPVGDVLGAVTRVERGGRRARLGLGPDGALVAALARVGLLLPLVAALRALRAPFVGRSVAS